LAKLSILPCMSLVEKMMICVSFADSEQHRKTNNNRKPDSFFIYYWCLIG